MIIVKSKTVKLSYDPDDSTITAIFAFKPTSEYRYFHVSPEHGEALKTVKSLGAYMNQVIKPTYKKFEEILIG